MIKNERQYRVTKAQLRAFQEAAENMQSFEAPKDVEPELLASLSSAMSSQEEELIADIEEYEALQRGDVSSFVAESLSEVPRNLIKARIALGLTQKELAERIGVKEQQVQRWESMDYENASLDTLKQVIRALGVETREELFLPNESLTPTKFLQNLTATGIPKQFLLKRLLPSKLATCFENQGAVTAGFKDILHAANAVSKVYGAQVSDLVRNHSPKLSFAGMATTRFKLPARTKTTALDAYVIYAHYLAALVESCACALPQSTFPADWHSIHHALTKPGVPMDLANTINYFWDQNVIVLPLRDEGAFHGAVWKIRGHFVVIIKQKTDLESRWLYDLLHEGGHIAHGHISEDSALIEDEPISPEARGSEEEQANEWAEDAIFDGESSLAEDACVQACRGRLQNLLSVLPKVAKSMNLNEGALANHMAFRLAAQGEQWWGAAHNLQANKAHPFEIARDILLRRINLRRLSEFDRELLMRALTDE